MNSEVLLMYINVTAGVLVTIISALILWGTKQIIKMIKHLMSSQTSLLRSQILQMYETGCINSGMTLMQKSTIENLYKDYKALGGNGFVEEIMEKVHKMDNLG